MGVKNKYVKAPWFHNLKWLNIYSSFVLIQSLQCTSARFTIFPTIFPDKGYATVGLDHLTPIRLVLTNNWK